MRTLEWVEPDDRGVGLNNSMHEMGYGRKWLGEGLGSEYVRQ